MLPGRLRIAHCLRAPVGGLFRHVCDLASAQAAAGHEVGILCDAATGGAHAHDVLEELRHLCRLGIERIPMSRLPGFGDIPAIRWTGRMAGRWQVDILHGHGAKGGAYARLARVPAGTARPRRFYTPHGGSLHYSPQSPAGLAYLTFERLLTRRTDGLIFESAYGERVFRAKVGAPPCPARVIHNGLRPEEFTPVRARAGACDIVFVGELRRLKGVAVLLEALALLERNGMALTAAIVGDGPDARDFKAMAQALHIDSLVAFPGILPAREAFTRGRLLVVPSLAESFPYIVLEAVAARMPLIATDVGGIAEIFAGEAGRLVAAGDAAALAEAIGGARRQPDILKASAGRLHAHAKQAFTVEAMAHDIEAFYRTAQ